MSWQAAANHACAESRSMAGLAPRAVPHLLLGRIDGKTIVELALLALKPVAQLLTRSIRGTTLVRALKVAQARSVVIDRLLAVVIRCLGERVLFLLHLLGQLVCLFHLRRCLPRGGLPRGCTRVDSQSSIRTEVDNVYRHDLLRVLPHENFADRRVAGVAAELLLDHRREGVWVDQAVHDEDRAASACILVRRAHVAVHAVHAAAPRKAVHTTKDLLIEAVQRDRSRAPYVGCPMVDIPELAFQSSLGAQHALLLFVLGLPHAHPTPTNRRNHAPVRD